MNFKIEIETKLVKNLKNKSFLITGASGFFGGRILDYLIKQNLEKNLNLSIFCLTRNISKVLLNSPVYLNFSFIKFLEGEISTFSFPDIYVDYVIHMAAVTAEETNANISQLYKLKNFIDGTENILKFCVKRGVKKVLFTSSGVVYGDYGEYYTKVPETFIGAPLTTNVESAVGEGKRVAEFLCAYYHDRFNLDYVVARCFSFAGIGLPLNLHYALGNFINDAINGRNIFVKGDGTQLRAYLDVDDLSIWLLEMLVSKTPAKVYNVGSDESISILKLAELVKDLINPKLRIDCKGNSNLSVGSFSRNFYVPNIDRVKNDLNLDVWTSLKKTILNSVPKK